MCATQTVIREKTLVKELIELYRDLPCLWNPKDKLYTDQDARDEANRILLEKYKLIEENADLNSLKNKINNLRSSFKRQHKKVTQSKCKQTLWYYNLMLFLIDDSGRTNSPEGRMPFEEDEETTASIKNELIPDAEEAGTSFLTEEHLAEASSSTDRVNESFGRTIGIKLYELTNMQKTIAEKLISEVIYYGRLGRLTTATKMIHDDLEG